MKVLEGLDQVITDFRGESVRQTLRDGSLTDFTIRDCLLQALGNSRQSTERDFKDVLTAYEVGTRIFAAGDRLEIEDHQFDLVVKAVKEGNFTVVAGAALAKILNKAREGD